MTPVSPLLMAGNKRSGTSQVVRLLNLHPEVFVSHESDVVWLLLQQSRGVTPAAHPDDSAVGLRQTMESLDVLRPLPLNTYEAFVAIQRHVMAHGSPWLGAISEAQKPHLRWIGDKKPFQHTDPFVVAFARLHLPRLKFLHVVRHPFAVVESSNRFNRTSDGDFWLNLSDAEKLERWVLHEQRVIEIREQDPENVLTIRYEDVCMDPGEAMRQVFEFLGLNVPTSLRDDAVRQTHAPRRSTLMIDGPNDDARGIAERYGYDLSTGGV